MNCYSQNDEQAVILKHFKDLPYGRFLDIGAHDGVHLSNTKALAELGWSGVLVEPNPTHFLSMIGLYGGMEPRFQLFNCAVSSGFGVSKLLWNYQWPAYSSTLSEEKAREFCGNDYSKSFYVSTLAIDALKTFGPYHFVSLDVEGMEIPILANMQNILHETSLLCVEYCPKTKGTIETQIGGHGFKVIHTTPENLLAVKI